MTTTLGALALALILAGCKDQKPETDAEARPAAGPEAKPEAKPEAEPGDLDRLLVYLPAEVTSVAYDRMSKRLDPDVVEVVFALPPASGDLLDERKTLDEGLDIVLDGDADPGNWLAPSSLAFTVPLAKTPYFVRPLLAPAAELGPLLEQGFTKTTVDEVEVWLPTGSFPWRVAVLDGEVAAFIPVDIVGTGVEPLLSARDQQNAAVEDQLAATLKQDGLIELVLFSAGPLVHLDVGQPIAQVQFALRRAGESYEGQLVLAPGRDADECITDLRAREHPEENQQVQALLGSVEFTKEQGGVVGRLAIAPDQLKHFIDR